MSSHTSSEQAHPTRHAGFHLGQRFSTDRSEADYGGIEPVQYGDFLDDKARQSKARHLATPTARFYDYSIRTLNLPGPFPRIQG
jgi:hypothetical protein